MGHDNREMQKHVAGKTPADSNAGYFSPFKITREAVPVPLGYALS